MVMWEAATIKVQFSYSQAGTEVIKSCSSIKLRRSKSFRLAKTMGGGKGEWSDT